jgi:hypothetical protein
LKFNLKFNHKLVKEENVFTLESDLSYIINIYKALNYFIKEDLMKDNNKIYCPKLRNFMKLKKDSLRLLSNKFNYSY